jgi:hypothetical protein
LSTITRIERRDWSVLLVFGDNCCRSSVEHGRVSFPEWFGWYVADGVFGVLSKLFIEFLEALFVVSLSGHEIHDVHRRIGVFGLDLVGFLGEWLEVALDMMIDLMADETFVEFRVIFGLADELAEVVVAVDDVDESEIVENVVFFNSRHRRTCGRFRGSRYFASWRSAMRTLVQ